MTAITWTVEQAEAAAAAVRDALRTVDIDVDEHVVYYVVGRVLVALEAEQNGSEEARP